MNRKQLQQCESRELSSCIRGATLYLKTCTRSPVVCNTAVSIAGKVTYKKTMAMKTLT